MEQIHPVNHSAIRSKATSILRKIASSFTDKKERIIDRQRQLIQKIALFSGTKTCFSFSFYVKTTQWKKLKIFLP